VKTIKKQQNERENKNAPKQQKMIHISQFLGMLLLLCIFLSIIPVVA
jgi:uncharacterized Tic20 family protein